jgi:putative CocE/NonD family hydrolase
MRPGFSTSWWYCLIVSAGFSLLEPNQAAELPYVCELNVKIPMRDGTALAANVYRPKQDGRYPVILTRTPYGKPDEKWGEATRYTGAGYVMVVQDCRGRGKSDGEWDPFRYDAEDGFDTQEWVGHQSWCSGEIGTSGGSYVGWSQWASSPKSSPYLKAMVPVVPFANTYDWAYQNGAMQLALLMGWGQGVGGVNLSPEKLQAGFRHLPLSNYADQFEKKVSYLNEWVAHPTYDAYWKQRGIDYRYAEITVPILNIGGWFDIFSKDTIELVNHVRASSNNKAVRRNEFVIMGPWTHGVGANKVGEWDLGKSANLPLNDLQFQWFEYWLKGHETGVQNWPALYLFVMGENRWRGENEWPLKRTQFIAYYLHGSGHANSSAGDGTLGVVEPGTEAPDHYTYDGNDPVPSVGGNNLVGASAGPYDQSSVEARQDVLVYTTPVLEQDLEVTGPVKLILWAASSARDTDFTGKLVDVNPDGKAYNLCDGILRARYRHGSENLELLEPGKPEKMELDLWVTCNLFKKGHRVRLEVSSSNFPRFDRNPNSGKPFGSDTELLSANQTILHDRDHASHLLLPVIPR